MQPLQPLNDFLIEYFKLFRMMDMRDNHTEQWAHFEDMITSGDMTKDVEKWADKLLQKDAAGKFIRIPAPNGEYQIINLPDTHGATHNELTLDDWETLFRICQNVFYQLNQDRASFAGNDKVLDFLNEWQHLFTDTNTGSVVATPATEVQCDNLAKLLRDNETYLKNKLKRDSEWAGILDPGTNYRDLIDGLTRKKYNKNDKFREKIQTLAGKINNAYETDPNFARNVIFRSTPAAAPTRPNLRLIHDTYAPGWTQPLVNASKLQTFQEQYQSLFNTLYKEDKILDAFKSKEGDDHRISAAVEAAKKGIDYDDTNSKNYISPKRDDALTPMQQLQKWANDTYEDCFEKYAKLKGDRLFFSKYAKIIAKALDKNGIKPTDGIEGLCKGDKISKVVASLKTTSQNASEHFDWMSKTLTEFTNDPNMKKTVAGALKNGLHMRNLVSELIIKAVEDNKVEQAKTALEVLSVMKYGATTSKVMETFRKQEFSIFSDGKLSWNKNEGVKFVSNAIDKSIKTAFDAAGYIVTFVGNEYRLLGSKFDRKFQHGKNDKTGAKLKHLSNAHDASVAAERATFNTNKTIADAADTAEKTRQTTKRDNALGALGLAGSPDASAAVERKGRAIQETLRPAQSAAYSVFQPLQARLDTYDEVLRLLEKRSELQRRLTEFNTRLAAAPSPAEVLSIQEEIKLLSADIGKNHKEIEDYQGLYSPELDNLDTKTPLYMKNLRDTFEASPEYTNAKNAYDNISDEIYKRENAIKQFRDAESEIQNLDDAIKKRQKKETEWDKDHKNAYQELIAYWDMLETGRDSHTGKMYSWTLGSKKLKQKAFDANKQAIIDSYWTLNNQSYAA